MNATPSATPDRSDRPWLAGALLIGIGALLLVAQFVQPLDADWIALGGISALFLALYVAQSHYGFLVPGMILAGLAIGVGLEDLGYSLNGSAVVLGLASGFIAIYLVSAVTGRSRLWWPLIPGGILAMVGGSQVAGGTEAERFVATWWPVALIAVGLLVLLVGRPRVTPDTSRTRA